METRSLLERVVCGEITEQQADEIHETRMGRLEVNFIVGKVKRSAEKAQGSEQSAIRRPE